MKHLHKAKVKSVEEESFFVYFQQQISKANNLSPSLLLRWISVTKTAPKRYIEYQLLIWLQIDLAFSSLQLLTKHILDWKEVQQSKQKTSF